MAELVILDPSNLYATGKVLVFPEGDEILVMQDLVITPKEQDEYYTVRTNDRIDLIAHKYYGKKVANGSRYWWVIAIANGIGIDEPVLDLSDFVGQNILIPDIFRVKLLLQ